jgi:NADH-quinone oxidoreductase subunit F
MPALRDYEAEAKAYKPVLMSRFSRPKSHTLADYLETQGYEGAKKALKMAPGEITDLVKKSGLRGRGGAGFATGLKWSFVPGKDKVPGPRYLCVNADESEPGTCKDRLIMELDPHQLIEGTMICAYAIGCNHAYIYIRGEMLKGYERMQAAIDEAYAKGILGKNIFQSGFDLDMTMHRGAGAYICGEETGLISSLEGGRGYPRLKPPFPAVKGLFGQPTIVNNVETLANLPHMFSRGLEWFTSMGTPPLTAAEAPPRGMPGSQGPKMFCISGHVNKPGVYEFPLGVSLRTVLYDERYGGGIWKGRKLKAVVPGGSSMKILRANEIDVQVCYDKLQAAGTSLGSAGCFVMDETTCIVNAGLNLMKFYAHESCGQCTPCREGSGWMAKLFHRIEKGQGRAEDLETIDLISKQACGKTICVMAEAFSWPAESYVAKFKDEFKAHIEKGACPFGGKLCEV